MGWDQDVCRNSVRDFLLDLMAVDAAQIISEALDLKMEDVGLTHEVAPAINGNGEPREEGDGMCNSFQPDVITLSDGRVFIETLVESTCGDDWGSDFYSFVEVGKPFEFTRNEHVYDMDGDGENSVVTTKEERMSTYMLPDPVIPEVATAHTVMALRVKFGVEGRKFTTDEVRDQGGVFGEFVADYMEDHGLDHISFEPGDEEE
jgi:hypothetical protein